MIKQTELTSLPHEHPDRIMDNLLRGIHSPGEAENALATYCLALLENESDLPKKIRTVRAILRKPEKQQELPKTPHFQRIICLILEMLIAQSEHQEGKQKFEALVLARTT